MTKVERKRYGPIHSYEDNPKSRGQRFLFDPFSPPRVTLGKVKRKIILCWKTQLHFNSNMLSDTVKEPKLLS